MRIPTKVRPGEPVSAKHLNDMIDMLRSLQPSGGPGIRVTRGMNGVSMAVKVTQKAQASPAAAVGPQPFDVEFSDPANPGDIGTKVTATVRPGTLNGLVPTNILTTPELTIATAYYLLLSAVVADGAVTSCSLSFPTSTPSGMPTAEGQPPLAFDYLLGMIVEGVWYRTIGNGSLFASAYEVFRVGKTAPDPGTLPYDIWYSWALTDT